MGLFNRGIETLERYGYEEVDTDSGKVYKLVNGFSVGAMFIFAGIIVVALTGFIEMSSTVFGIVASLMLICFGLLMSLYWIRRIEQKEFRITSIVFLSLIGFSVLLWIICVWLGVSIYKDLRYGNEPDINRFVGMFKFIQITSIFTVQFAVATFVGKGVTKFRKTMLPFQIVAYISYLFFDFYITYALACIQLSASDGFALNENAVLLTNRWMIMFFILAIVYVGISKGVIRGAEKRKLRNMLVDEFDKNNKRNVKAKEPTKTPAEKLENLKQLLDQNLITQEEYDQKKAEILKDM